VTPADEHDGRGPQIRSARRNGLRRARSVRKRILPRGRAYDR